MGKHWGNEEIALACQAYISATRNPISGADQDVNQFTSDLISKLEINSPKFCDPGTYYKRGKTVYPYLRDSVFPNVQKFQKALRIIYLSNPTGVIEQEKMNMAVAIHMKKVSRMDYAMKNFDPNSWKFYRGWLQLKKIPKFAFTSHGEETVVSSLDGSAADEGVQNIDSPRDHDESRGGGRGKKAAQVAKLKEDKEDRKRKRQEEHDKKFDGILAEMNEIKSIMKKKSSSTIIRTALKCTNDPEMKKKLEDKLLKLALEIDI